MDAAIDTRWTRQISVPLSTNVVLVHVAIIHAVWMSSLSILMTPGEH